MEIKTNATCNDFVRSQAHDAHETGRENRVLSEVEQGEGTKNWNKLVHLTKFDHSQDFFFQIMKSKRKYYLLEKNGFSKRLRYLAVLRDACSYFFRK